MSTHDYSHYCVPVLQANTSHLSAQENTRLRDQEVIHGVHAVFVSDHGQMVWVPLDEPIRAPANTGLGQALRIARKLKAHYIYFDADVPCLPDVRTYEW